MTGRIGALVLAGALLSGCASPATDYSASAAADLQKRVLAVTEAAATGDAVAALVRLQELEAAAYDAAARSRISERRLSSILSSIALVRADLEKALSHAELAELQQRLEELENEQPGEQVEQGGSTGGGDEEQEKADKEAAKKAEEERKKAEEEARKAEEEARKAEEEARKKAEEEAKKAEEEAKKEQEDGEDDD